MAPADIPRLDYTKPPPVDLFSLRGLELLPEFIQKEKLQNAWAGYKHRHDPPGIDVARASGHPIPWWAYRDRLCLLGRETEHEAREAAWTWHDRRHALAAALEDVGVQLDLWPGVLVFSEGDCEACESWLKRGPGWAPDDFPAVLKAIAAAEHRGG